MKNIIDRKELRKLLGEYVVDYIAKSEDDDCKKYVIGHIPIVWFGDIDAYETSDIKVVTVAINPSDREFTNIRFDENINVRDDVNIVTERLSNTLNRYFDYNPYEWFKNGFEIALNSMETSYFRQLQIDKKWNQAIHIDIYSAIATSKKWTQIPPKEQKIIQNDVLFKKLLKILNPDIIISCCDQEVFNLNFKNNRFAMDNSESNYDWIWDYEYTYQGGIYRKNSSKEINTNKAQYIRVFWEQSSKKKMLIWGKTRNLPFGGFPRNNNKEFDSIFTEIIQEYKKRNTY